MLLGLLPGLLLVLLLGLLVRLLLGRADGTVSDGSLRRQTRGRLDQIRGPSVGTLGWRNRPEKK